MAVLPLYRMVREREGPDAKRWEGEGVSDRHESTLDRLTVAPQQRVPAVNADVTAGGRHSVTSGEFARAMARFAPFETCPDLAIAVSGGADSMALAVLGKAWAEAMGGRARAFIVDHGLRPESGDEADLVAERCRAIGLEADILVWTGGKPARGIQAAAREARYDLLATACRRARVLHLLVAHHRDDQAETVALRAERGSTGPGLAGMTAAMEWRGLRVLRPLLEFGKDRLVATVRSRALAWVEDPSNANPAFSRVRLRQSGKKLPAAAEIRTHQRRRLQAELQAAKDLVTCVVLHPAGYAVFDDLAWQKLNGERRLFVLNRLAMTIGGLQYAPRQDRLGRFLDRLDHPENFSSGTLGRCYWQRCGKRLRVTRENRHLPSRAPVEAGKTTRWDGRFQIKSAIPGLSVGILGREGWRFLRDSGLDRGLPQRAAVVLPAFYDLEGLAAVPYVQWQRDDAAAGRVVAGFAPYHALAPAGFVTPQGDDPKLAAGAY